MSLYHVAEKFGILGLLVQEVSARTTSFYCFIFLTREQCHTQKQIHTDSVTNSTLNFSVPRCRQ